ncbi:MAG TPA: hypothetical protein ENO30_02200 [Thermodesulfobium narugense]|nr:hypothetical protein [Thermodesulfobium narugense]
MKVADFVKMHYPEFYEKAKHYEFWKRMGEFNLILIPLVPLHIRVYDQMDVPVDDVSFVKEISSLQAGFFPKASFDMEKGAVVMVGTPSIEAVVHYIGKIVFEATDELWSTYRWKGEDLFWYAVNNQIPEELLEESLKITEYAITDVITIENIQRALHLYFNKNPEEIDFATSEVLEYKFQLRRDTYRYLVKQITFHSPDTFDEVMTFLNYYTKEARDVEQA